MGDDDARTPTSKVRERERESVKTRSTSLSAEARRVNKRHSMPSVVSSHPITVAHVYVPRTGTTATPTKTAGFRGLTAA